MFFFYKYSFSLNDRFHKLQIHNLCRTGSQTIAQIPESDKKPKIMHRPEEMIDDVAPESEGKLQDVKMGPGEPISLDCDEDEEVTIITKDKKKFVVKKKYTVISKFLTTVLTEDPTNEVTLDTVHSDVFKYVVDYMNHHKGVEPEVVPRPLRYTQMEKVCADKWDAQFVDQFTEYKQVHPLMNVASYLHMDTLMYLAAAKIASFFKDKPLVELRDAYKNQDDEKEQKEQKEEKAKPKRAKKAKAKKAKKAKTSSGS